MMKVLFQEILNRIIYDDIRDSMEGQMTLHKMTKVLNEDMKGTSAPGEMDLQSIASKNLQAWVLQLLNC